MDWHAPPPLGRRATLIPTVRALTSHPDASAALDLLHAAAWTVEPLQRARGWAVGELLEFAPRSAALLGVNIGGGGGSALRIKIRLRPPDGGGGGGRRPRSNGFLPFDAIVHTLLHELAHCVVGPHNARFYSILDGLLAECDALRARGVGGTGAGFDAPAAGRVGGRGPRPGPTGDVPAPVLVREAAARAAEARAARAAVMPAGPRVVGGGDARGEWARLPPAAAAAAAALRRARDDVWCGEGGEEEVIVLSSDSES